MILIGIVPLSFAGFLITKTKLQAISFIKQLPEDSLMYLGLGIAFCCLFVAMYGFIKLIDTAKKLNE